MQVATINEKRINEFEREYVGMYRKLLVKKRGKGNDTIIL